MYKYKVQKHYEVNPKKITHYYVDGGVKEQTGVAAFIRKSYYGRNGEGVRRYEKNISSSDTEIRAIKIAMDDAKKRHLNPKYVVIHTDQRQINYPNNKTDTELKILHDELVEQGFKIAYLKSHHENFSKTTKPDNAFLVHSRIQKEFTKKPNRYRAHLNKKRNQKGR